MGCVLWWVSLCMSLASALAGRWLGLEYFCLEELTSEELGREIIVSFVIRFWGAAERLQVST